MHLHAKYLILHGKDELETDKIFKLTAKGPRIFSRNDLLKKGYPEPRGELYVVFQLERDASDDLKNKNRFKEIDQFETYRNSAKPFSATLSEVLKSKSCGTLNDLRSSKLTGSGHIQRHLLPPKRPCFPVLHRFSGISFRICPPQVDNPEHTGSSSLLVVIPPIRKVLLSF